MNSFQPQAAKHPESLSLKLSRNFKIFQTAFNIQESAKRQAGKYRNN